MAVATASMAHRVRPSTSIPRCVPLVPRVRSIQPHRLTRVRACAARPSELLIHLVQGAEDAVFVTEKLSVAGQRSSFDRGAGAWPRRSRAAPRELPRAAAALPRPAADPQWSRGTPAPFPRPVECVVALPPARGGSVASRHCRGREGMFVSLPVAYVVDLCACRAWYALFGPRPVPRCSRGQRRGLGGVENSHFRKYKYELGRGGFKAIKG